MVLDLSGPHPPPAGAGSGANVERTYTAGMDGREPGPESGTDAGRNAPAPSIRWQLARIRRHLGWARTQGLGRLIEEDQLNPFESIPTALRKAAWRLRNDVSPHARPVFLVGLQRSGTNMIVRGLERSPEFQVHNENDRAAFQRFRLRPDPVIRALVVRSPHAFVLFKPLCDSHRIAALLDELGTPTPGKALWAFRSVDGRVRSSLAKFGDSSRRALRRIAAGRGGDLWQAQGLSPESLELIRSFDDDRLSPGSASALFWYVRNAIVFEHGLHERDDVLLVSYDRIVEEPAAQMRRLCDFLGLSFDERLVSHIEPRHAASDPALGIDPEIRRLCEALGERLRDAAEVVPVARPTDPEPGGPDGDDRR